MSRSVAARRKVSGFGLVQAHLSGVVVGAALMLVYLAASGKLWL